MRDVRGSAVLVFLLSFVPARAHAQLNVERLRGDLRVAPATASMEGSFTGRTGNIENVVFGGAAIASARWRRHQIFFSTQADYAKFNGKTIVSKSFIHARYDYKLVDRIFAELFAQQQQDKFQRLQYRELLGAGPRFLLSNEEDVRVAYGTAYMLEYEKLLDIPGTPDARETVAHRFSNYVSTTWRPDARVRALGTLYLQPRFDRWDDVRVLFEATLITDVVDRLGVKVIATVRHDTAPPTTVKHTDVEVKNAIVLTF